MLEVVLLIEGRVVTREAGFLGLVAARLESGRVDVADVIEQRVGEAADLAAVSACLEEMPHLRLEACRGRVELRRGADVAAVVTKARVVESRVPVQPLKAGNAPRDGVGKVVVVREVAQPKGRLQTLHVLSARLADEDVIHHVGELLGGHNAFVWSVQPGSLVVFPIVDYGLGDARRGDGAPVDIRVQLAQEGNEGACVRAPVGDPRVLGRRQVVVLQPWESDMLRKVGHVSECLVRGQEAEILGAEVGRRVAPPILQLVSVLSGSTISGASGAP